MLNLAKAVTIDGWMDRDELVWLADQADDVSLTLEIGSFHGRSSRGIADSTEGRLVSVDRWFIEDDYRQNFETNLRDLIESGKVIPIRATSMQAFQILRATFDIIFIDADHSFDAVVDDINCWRTRLNPGGLLCGHDLDHPHFPGVRAALEHLGIPFKRGPGSLWYKEP